MNKELTLLTALGFTATMPGISCGQTIKNSGSKSDKPNVILILADDLGYETLGCNGGLSYKTPVLDQLASQGIRFTQCYSNPLCSPSRVGIMTGKYNFRNYEYFEYLNTSIKTFGNLMQDAGYATAMAGKWQLNGIRWKYPSALDPTTANHFGFDEYLLWQLTHTRQEGERYASPLLETDGKILEGVEDSYGPDELVKFINDFIDRKKDQPFFVYYSMVLTHDPFVVTPDSKEWLTTDDRYKADNAYFTDMVAYMDKMVGEILANLKEEGLLDNTIILFTGDNGTNVSIVSKTVNGDVKGGKGSTLNTGNHVPLIVSWPATIKKGRVYDGLISFIDFLPTFADAAGVDYCSYAVDGISFMPVIKGSNDPLRSEIFMHYTPEWANFKSDRWVFDGNYKLYQNGDFFNTIADPLEKNKLSTLTPAEQEIYNRFDKVIKEKEAEFPFRWSNASDENPRPAGGEGMPATQGAPGQRVAPAGNAGQGNPGQRTAPAVAPINTGE